MRDQSEQHLRSYPGQEFHDPLAGEDRGVDVLESAPASAHWMLETEAVQGLCGYLEQKGFHQRCVQDLSERGIVLADQADLDETRRDRQRIAASALGGCPYRREHLGVVFRRPCAGRPPAIGVPSGDVEHPRAAGPAPARWPPVLVR